jgi:hypothetical protein
VQHLIDAEARAHEVGYLVRELSQVSLQRGAHNSHGERVAEARGDGDRGA